MGLLSFRGFVGSLQKPQLEELELCLCSWVVQAPGPGPLETLLCFGQAGPTWSLRVSSGLMLPHNALMGLPGVLGQGACVQDSCHSTDLWCPHTSSVSVVS